MCHKVALRELTVGRTFRYDTSTTDARFFCKSHGRIFRPFLIVDVSFKPLDKSDNLCYTLTHTVVKTMIGTGRFFENGARESPMRCEGGTVEKRIVPPTGRRRQPHIQRSSVGRNAPVIGQIKAVFYFIIRNNLSGTAVIPSQKGFPFGAFLF